VDEILDHRREPTGSITASLASATGSLLVAALLLALKGRMAHLAVFPLAAIVPVVLIAEHRRVARRRRSIYGEVPSSTAVWFQRAIVSLSIVLGIWHAYLFAETFG
jgi:hypothetical protein